MNPERFEKLFTLIASLFGLLLLTYLDASTQRYELLRVSAQINTLGLQNSMKRDPFQLISIRDVASGIFPEEIGKEVTIPKELEEKFTENIFREVRFQTLLDGDCRFFLLPVDQLPDPLTDNFQILFSIVPEKMCNAGGVLGGFPLGVELSYSINNSKNDKINKTYSIQPKNYFYAKEIFRHQNIFSGFYRHKSICNNENVLFGEIKCEKISDKRMERYEDYKSLNVEIGLFEEDLIIFPMFEKLPAYIFISPFANILYKKYGHEYITENGEISNWPAFINTINLNENQNLNRKKASIRFLGLEVTDTIFSIYIYGILAFAVMLASGCLLRVPTDGDKSWTANFYLKTTLGRLFLLFFALAFLIFVCLLSFIALDSFRIPFCLGPENCYRLNPMIGEFFVKLRATTAAGPLWGATIVEINTILILILILFVSVVFIVMKLLYFAAKGDRA